MPSTSPPIRTYYELAQDQLIEVIYNLAPIGYKENLKAHHEALKLDNTLTSQDIACRLTYILNIGLQFGEWRH